MPDREKVIGHLNDCMEASRRDNTWVFVRKDIVEDALAMLKEQEAVKPYIDIDEAKCPICKVKLTRQELIGDNVLYEDFFDYCPHCGKAVKWDD
jgi:uncharacterized protein with PIN domain